MLLTLPAAGGQASRPLQGLTSGQQRAFEEGERLFLTEWVAAPAAKGVKDGLGPFFNASSCVACHPSGGRGVTPGAPDPMPGLIFRVGSESESLLDEYGSQLSSRALPGVKPEGMVTTVWTEQPGTLADNAKFLLRVPAYAPRDWQYGAPPADLRLSPRLAPALHGIGLLEAVEASAILALADPDDKNGDGISGRPNFEETWEGYDATVDVAGRFGWKAWMPTLMRQVCGALGEDMGITNVFQPHDATPAQSDVLEDYARGGHGSLFEADGRDVERLVSFVRFLAPTERRDAGNPDVEKGAALFVSVNCTACHLPELKTGNVRGAKSLSGQTIHPFTDLLLHDMGPALADGRAEAKADGREWRTAPLWGLAAVVDEKGAGLLLHDGRARNLEEAILWHGGEGEKSRGAYQSLPAADRTLLLRYLRSL